MSSSEQGASIRDLNTFGFSSRAALYYTCLTQTDVEVAVKAASRAHLPVLVLGEGSNVVLGEALQRAVISLANEDIRCEDSVDGVLVTVGAGCNWHQLVTAMVDASISGLENLALIPGKVGAAPVQNIGAYGVELKDVFESLLAYDTASNEWKTFKYADCDFGYRNSVFKSQFPDRYIIFSVTLRLSREFKPKLGYAGLGDLSGEIDAKALFDRVVEVRSAKLPDPSLLGNAGSFFENPVIPHEQWQALSQQFPAIVAFDDRPGFKKLAAGWLIDQAGWKGKRQGDVGVYDKQALVLVNYGDGNAAQLLALADDIKASVLAKFGIQLSQEPRNYLR